MFRLVCACAHHILRGKVVASCGCGVRQLCILAGADTENCECARAKARPLGGLGACSPRKILKFRSSEIDSSAFLRKKCDE